VDDILEADEVEDLNLVQKGFNNYTQHEDSGMDRLQSEIADTIEKYNSDFGKGLVQGAAGSLTAPGALYDGIKEWTSEDYSNSVSFYDQMERNLEEDKPLPRKIGEAAGYTTGALLGLQHPELFIAGAAQNARHIGERKVHEKLKEYNSAEKPAS
jgi:hypothetical protein